MYFICIFSFINFDIYIYGFIYILFHTYFIYILTMEIASFCHLAECNLLPVFTEVLFLIEILIRHPLEYQIYARNVTSV